MDIDKLDRQETVLSAADFAQLGGQRLVYVREVIAKDALQELSAEDSADFPDMPDDTVLYALHSADGERIALMGNRELAFAAARQHEMTPVNVH